MRLTVYFDGQYWCGLFEEDADTGLLVHRHVFGAEPGDPEILDVTREARLDGFARSDTLVPRVPPPLNPKRRAREAARAVRETGIGTRAQEAVKAAREAEAARHQAKEREIRAAREADLYEKRRARALKKHRGH